MPLLQEVEIISYDKSSNTCTGQNQYGELFEIDPFVGCAIYLSDIDYITDKGFEVIGNRYIMSGFTVYDTHVVPHEGCFTLKGE